MTERTNLPGGYYFEPLSTEYLVALRGPGISNLLMFDVETARAFAEAMNRTRPADPESDRLADWIMEERTRRNVSEGISLNPEDWDHIVWALKQCAQKPFNPDREWINKGAP